MSQPTIREIRDKVARNAASRGYCERAQWAFCDCEKCSAARAKQKNSDPFWQRPCGICGVPRRECCC